MFPKSILSFAPVSGFVAFDGGGTAPPAISLPTAKSPLVVEIPGAASPGTRPLDEPALLQSAVWQPRSSGAVRRVEAVVLAAVCSYFAVGAAGALHLI